MEKKNNINKIIEWNVRKIDKYLGTILCWSGSMILLIWMLFLAVGNTADQTEQFLKIVGKIQIYGQLLGIVMAALIVFYLLFVVGALGIRLFYMGLHMLFTSAVAIAGTAIIWWKCNIALVACKQVLGIAFLFAGMYFAQIYFRCRIEGKLDAENGCCNNDLVRCKSDKVYIPFLIEAIGEENLKKRIANEVYTYVYGAYKYKRIHYTLLILSIFLPAAVTALSGGTLFDVDFNNRIIPILSMSAVIVSGLFSSFKAKESWARYRKYAERAKNEIFCFVMEIEDYEDHDKKDNSKREKLLAERMENLFLEENKLWQEMRKQKDNEN